MPLKLQIFNNEQNIHAHISIEIYGNTCTKKGGKEKKVREKGENPAMIFNIVEKQRTKHLSHLKHIYRRAQYSYFNTVNII